MHYRSFVAFNPGLVIPPTFAHGLSFRSQDGYSSQFVDTSIPHLKEHCISTGFCLCTNFV
ncbi:Uncharacterized protein APZ42_017472 [Daphnia magna]|uniref:Uncharacterized protein n=1 Tax=Daphnia magna TaxID=35525 RepID=A0A0P5VEB3_9CRUS|nr:Uncharacterized protein APZ42_017472 [Daphnia magna]